MSDPDEIDTEPLISPDEARDEYRKAWKRWQSAGKHSKKEHEDRMDMLQTYIARGPNDPAWQEFINTIPGYREFWEFAHYVLDRRIKEYEIREASKKEARIVVPVKGWDKN